MLRNHDRPSHCSTVLQHPSVATSTLDQRISFLRSKNLTQAEIDLSLAKARDGSSIPSAPAPVTQPNYGQSNQQRMRSSADYGYGPYQGWPWSLPLEYGSIRLSEASCTDSGRPPRRDWRDWFIMATVTGGVSYSLYVIAKVYRGCLPAGPF